MKRNKGAAIGINYFLRIDTEGPHGLDRDTIPLDGATTDMGARRKATAYLREHPVHESALVGLMFNRHSDGFTGEIEL